MALRKIVDLNAESTVAMDEVGQNLSGYYLGFKTVQGGFGPSKLHVFQGEGGTVGAWGGAQLDAKLATVPKGFLTFVTLNALSVIKNKKRTPKGYDVEFDDEQSIDVSNVAVNLSSEPKDEQELPEETSGEPADTDQDEPEAEEEEETQPEPIKTAPAKKGTPAPISQATKDKAMAALQKARSASRL